MLPFVLLAPDQTELRHRPAGLGVGHPTGDDQLRVERDDLLPVRRSQRNVAARHVAELASVIEHDVLRRVFPFKPAVLIGINAEMDRPASRQVSAPKNAPATGLPSMSTTLPRTHRSRLGQLDLDGCGPLVDPDVADLGREALGLDRDDRRAGVAVSRVNSPRSFVVPVGVSWIKTVVADEGPGSS